MTPRQRRPPALEQDPPDDLVELFEVVEQAVDDEVDATRWDVREPGVVDGMPDDVYHGDPVPEWSLSSTGARLITQHGGPAKWRHLRDNPAPSRPVWELGRALHGRVLGVGTGYVVPVDEHGEPYAEWRTNRAKEQVAEIRAAGYVPLKADDARTVEQMADRILDHPDARELLEQTIGRAEVSGFVRDPVHGVWLRARWDYLPETDGGLLVIPDLKSARDASDAGMAKAMGDNGLHRQSEWYERVAKLLQLAEDVVVVLIAQEKEPPYLVNVVRPARHDLVRAALLNDMAVERFAACKESGVWPGYGDALHTVEVAGYAATRETQELNG